MLKKSLFVKVGWIVLSISCAGFFILLGLTNHIVQNKIEDFPDLMIPLVVLGAIFVIVLFTAIVALLRQKMRTKKKRRR